MPLCHQHSVTQAECHRVTLRAGWCEGRACMCVCVCPRTYVGRSRVCCYTGSISSCVAPGRPTARLACRSKACPRAPARGAVYTYVHACVCGGVWLSCQPLVDRSVLEKPLFWLPTPTTHVATTSESAASGSGTAVAPHLRATSESHTVRQCVCATAVPRRTAWHAHTQPLAGQSPCILRYVHLPVRVHTVSTRVRNAHPLAA